MSKHSQKFWTNYDGLYVFCIQGNVTAITIFTVKLAVDYIYVQAPQSELTSKTFNINVSLFKGRLLCSDVGNLKLHGYSWPIVNSTIYGPSCICWITGMMHLFKHMDKLYFHSHFDIVFSNC